MLDTIAVDIHVGKLSILALDVHDIVVRNMVTTISECYNVHS